MKYHGIAFLCGFILDLILGDPEGWPHPVRWIGRLIAFLDEKFMGKQEKGVVQKKSDGAEKRSGGEGNGNSTGSGAEKKAANKKAYRKGILLVLIVVTASAAGAAVPLIIGYSVHPVLGIIIETILTWWLLAIRSLRTESMAVYRKLAKKDLPGAQKQVARIVGRDTDVLDEKGVARAAVETIAESTCDGILAPMLYTAIAGPVLGFAAKAINTMDSMVGYKSERYKYFGRAAALIDDAVNFLPARLSALCIIAAAYILRDPVFSGADAVRIYRRDHKKSASPNAGHPESAIAGAMGIRLGGGAVYSGRFLPKDYMGDRKRPIEAKDIPRANTLMITASVVALVVFLLLIGFVWILSW